MGTSPLISKFCCNILLDLNSRFFTEEISFNVSNSISIFLLLFSSLFFLASISFKLLRIFFISFFFRISPYIFFVFFLNLISFIKSANSKNLLLIIRYSFLNSLNLFNILSFIFLYSILLLSNSSNISFFISSTLSHFLLRSFD